MSFRCRRSGVETEMFNDTRDVEAIGRKANINVNKYIKVTQPNGVSRDRERGRGRARERKKSG